MFAKRDHHWWRQESALLQALWWGGFLLIVTAVSYLAMVNRTATLGLEIRDLERTKGELEEMSQRLQRSTMKMQSLEYVAEQSSALQLVKPKQVSYVDAGLPTPLSIRQLTRP